MSEPLLRIDDLTAGYDNAAVVRNLSLTVGEGQVVALFGANGAGKTTTLRTISGLIEPMHGSVRFGGSDLRGVSVSDRARSGIAHLPEGGGTYHGLTVAEHLRIGSRRQPLDEAAVYEYFPALDKLRTRRAGLMSGGEQRMLGIGRALARRPRLLLLDELSLGLAPVIVEKILPVVRKYSDETGCGVLLVEQHVQLGVEIADRGYVLSHGNLVLEADAERLRRDRHLIRASYLGEHNAAARELD